MPRPPIQDEFTDLPVSRQRKFQLRLKRDKLCQRCCKAEAEIPPICYKCRIAIREEVRKRKGAKRRYDSMSYRMEDLKRRKKGVAKVLRKKNEPAKTKGDAAKSGLPKKEPAPC